MRKSWLIVAALLFGAGVFFAERREAARPTVLPLPKPLRKRHGRSLTAPPSRVEMPTATKPLAKSRLARDVHLKIDDLTKLSLLGLPAPFLRFSSLSSKAIRTRSEVAECLELASRRQLITRAVDDLQEYQRNEQQAMARRRRMALVDYLRFALRRGPEADFIEDAVVAMLRQPLPAPGEPLEVRKAYVGDRIELLLALLQHDQDASRRLTERLTGTPGEKEVAYAQELLSAWRP